MKTLLHFTAAWCGPCRAMEPHIKDMVAKDNRFTYEKVDVDKEPDMAEQYAVTSIPTLIMLEEDGSVGTRTVGGKTAAGLKDWVEKALADGDLQQTTEYLNDR